MKLDFQHEGNNVIIVKINGEIDMGNADNYIAEIANYKDGDYKLIFDFSQVNFIDSTGIGMLIKFFKDNEKLKYTITNVQKDIQEIFDILNLAEVLGADRFQSTIEDALALLAQD
ncbi:MAG: STAS domain-containing protein [Halanaerobiaceae bacterium]|nr:STAS domain-containing protein [Halanaerobiaceae bacterium]